MQSENISALIFIKIRNLSETPDVVSILDLIPEVRNIHLMTGDSNIVLKLNTDSPDRLEEIIRKKIASIKWKPYFGFVKIITAKLQFATQFPLVLSSASFFRFSLFSTKIKR